MTSKDDDTMPLPGFSEELSTDITVDEDFIPTSQPQSTISSKMSRNSDTSFNKSSEEFTSQPVPISRIDDTLPPEAVMDQSENNKSADFIPDTETKKTKITYANMELSCKKKLPVFGPGDGFRGQTNPTWESDVSRIPESPALDTQNFSILKEFPTKVVSSSVTKREESITEIIVNDSAETVDLEASPVKKKKLEIERTEGKVDVDYSSNSDVERCEETQVFDNSVLLLEQPGPSSSGLETERISGVTPYLQETIEDNKENSQDRANAFTLQCGDVGPEFSRNSDNVKRETGDVAKLYQNEVQPKPNCTEPNSNAITSRKIDFKLNVSCLITFNATTNKIMHKSILQVTESVKSKPKPVSNEHSDNTSEKSKRHSTSSSGSVYSDKTGLPFALPVRYSIISDQTDSSEDDFGVICKKAGRNLERTPWSNEYLIPLKMDDIVQVAIEKEEFLRRPVMSSPRRPKSKRGVNQLQEILEGSSSSLTALRNSEPPPTKASAEEKVDSPLNSIPEAEKTDENIGCQNETDANNVGSENVQSEDKQQPANEREKQAVEPTQSEEETTTISLSEGLPVFARWTDKRYYSGVLSGSVKNDRWDVKFDDGTSKIMREDLIMPADWLKVGALVFALTDDKYESGQITDIKRGKEVNYIVALDNKKEEVSATISDLCLTDVMAGIVREKYKPVSGTPRRKADIDFDNVLSGKRLREQRTPLKPTGATGNGSSGLRKKSSKGKKDEAQNLAKETPQNKDTDTKIRVLKSDNGHLIEDKVISADSPSGNETGETPLRGASKGAKGKAKPRSLSYETEDKSGKVCSVQDGSPIAGPSGVKLKKQKTKGKGEEPEKPSSEETDPVPPKSSKKTPARSKAPQSSEKTKRKRKLDESVDENLQKKSLKGGGSKVKTRSRKG